VTELYHLERDLSERHNQAAAEPTRAQAMEARLREMAAELGADLSR